MGFRDVAEVQEFFEKNGEAALMAEIRSGRHGNDSQKIFAEWQAGYEVELRDDATKLTRRAVAAAERSAVASKDAARYSLYAVIVAIVALLVVLAKEWGWFG